MQSFLCDRIATYVQVSGICINNGVSLGNGAGMELAYSAALAIFDTVDGV